MSTTTISLGGGLSDVADIDATVDSTSDILSNVFLSTQNTYSSGGYDSLGNPYQIKPVVITDVTVLVGRYGNTNVGLKAQFSSYANGLSSMLSSSTLYTGIFQIGDSVQLSTQNGYKYRAYAGENYFYGIKGVSSGPIYYARGGSEGNIFYDGSTNSSTRRLSGSVSYDSIPNAPTSLALTGTVTDTTANISWTSPSDRGGANVITGYRVNYRNSTSGPWSVLVANSGVGGAVTTMQLTGLAPNTYYEIQLAALNMVTDYFNASYANITAHVGVRSSTLSFTTAQSTHNLRVFANGTYKKATIKIWDGSQWIGYPNIDIKVWNGTQFKDSALEL